MKKRRLVRHLLLSLGGLVLSVLVVIGPWPAYRSSHFEERGYFARAKEEMSFQLARQPGSPGPLQAGWAAQPLILPAGTPLAGYGDRKGKPAEGFHDPLHVKALCLDNTHQRVILFSSDLLIVPPNVAEKVRKRLWEELSLPAGAVLFNASHTHSGPGAGSRGLVARLFAGRFRREVEERIAAAFVAAAAEASASRESAEIGWGSAEVPEFIRNRTRSVSVYDELTDSRLDYLLVRKTSGDTCAVVRYSAHPTVIGPDSMLFSGDFPGYLQRSLEETHLDTAMYLAGAVGSMGPQVEKSGVDDYSEASIMGRALAAEVQRAIAGGGLTPLRRHVVLRTVGFPLLVPPLQLRFSRGWRLSPLFLRLAGVRRKAWLAAVSLDEMLFLALPCDLSGEISAVWRIRAEKEGIHLAPLSFNGAYAGYISPDAYYGDVYDNGKLAYETAVMSWCGPDQEAYFTSLFALLIQQLPMPVNPYQKDAP